MARLTKEEIRHHKSWLTEWRTPEETLKYVSRLFSYLGSADLFNQAGIDFLTEAHAAATFGIARDAAEVRLIRDSRPDFEMRVGNRVEKIELTEADLPGRQRGREYREAAEQAGPDGIFVEDHPVEEWVADAQQAPEALRKAANRKAKKNYARNFRLLIYLNIDEYGIRQKQIEQSFADTTAVVKDKFEEVWILWKKQAYKIWSKGERAKI